MSLVEPSFLIIFLVFIGGLELDSLSAVMLGVRVHLAEILRLVEVILPLEKSVEDASEK